MSTQRTPSDESRFDQLRQVGLSNLESKVYVALLKAGPTGARALAGISSVNRIDCYRSLKSLVRKGLVEIVISNPSIYIAVSPDLGIKTLLSEKERWLASLKTSSLDLQSWLESIQNKQSALIDDMNQQSYMANFSVKWGGPDFRLLQEVAFKCEKRIASGMAELWIADALRGRYNGILQRLLRSRTEDSWNHRERLNSPICD
jgi:hypothetical protein